MAVPMVFLGIFTGLERENWLYGGEIPAYHENSHNDKPIINPKFEIRNPKQIQMTKTQRANYK